MCTEAADSSCLRRLEGETGRQRPHCLCELGRGGQVLWMPPPHPEAVRSAAGWAATGCPGPLTPYSLQVFTDVPTDPPSPYPVHPSYPVSADNLPMPRLFCTVFIPAFKLLLFLPLPRSAHHSVERKGWGELGQQHRSSFGPLTVLGWTRGETHQDTWTHLWMTSRADDVSRRQPPCRPLPSSHTFSLKLPLEVRA